MDPKEYSAQSPDATDYVELILPTPDRHGHTAPVIITCEHASQRFPEPFRWPYEDAWLEGTHWAYDIGAAELTRELAAQVKARAVLSRFSRLLVDPNRPLQALDLFRPMAEGRPITMNQDVDESARALRLAMWGAYHDAVDEAVRQTSAPVILSMHTFTPIYEGSQRSVEVGVLFDEETELAESVQHEFVRAGVGARLNEPYSGKSGLIYSAHHHAKRHGRRALEIEVRQDLAQDPATRRRFVAILATAISKLG